jgi:hypothetical protein
MASKTTYSVLQLTSSIALGIAVLTAPKVEAQVSDTGSAALQSLPPYVLDNNWGTVPLGPNVELKKWGPAPAKRKAQNTLKVLPATGAPLTFIQGKQAQAAIVIAADAMPAIRKVANELQRIFAKMSGVRLPITFENKLTVRQQGADNQYLVAGKAMPYLIAVGNSKLGGAAGISVNELPIEGYRLKTVGNVLYIVGTDVTPGGMPVESTRHAMHGLLERHFGCRWLWPGETGEVVPERSTVALRPLDESDAPAIGQRLMRDMHEKINDRLQEGLRALGKTDDDWRKQIKNSSTWLDQQRLGRNFTVQYAHAYKDWWVKYGAQHPDWFALQPNGTRVQNPPRERLNIVNPEVVEAVAQQAIAQLEANPALRAASISPNDGSGNLFDMSEASRKYDPPNAPPFKFSYTKDGVAQSVMYPSLSDRYAVFYSRVAEIVAKKHPDRWVGAYAYSAYRTPPLYAKMHPNVLLAFVGLTYFDDQKMEIDRESWNGWAQSADKVLLRPNLLLLGHGMPAVYVHKMGDDIRHCYETGMMAADFDSIQHNWASQGLNYYVLARLLWNPAEDVDALIKDYCDAGFGNASPQVQRYFARLETLTNDIAKHNSKQAENELRAEEEEQVNDYDKFLLTIPLYYTPEVLLELNGVLDAAKQAAGTDTAVLARIEFLRQGLRYAKAQAEPLALRLQPKTPATVARVRQLLQERQRVFNDLFDNQFYSVNVAYLTYRERNFWTRYTG